ncbi:MAG: hypothetical protein DRP45_03555, partial [Candidatus Zixiibacteriota bacterium]
MRMLREMKNLIMVSVVAVAVLCSTGAAQHKVMTRVPDSVNLVSRAELDALLEKAGYGKDSYEVGSIPFKLMWVIAEPEHVKPGHVNLKVEVASTLPCGEVLLEVIDVHNLDYSGPRSWTTNARPDSPGVYHLDLVIPAKDTSGLELIATGCGGPTRSYFWYFIPNRDSIEFCVGHYKDDIVRRLSPDGMTAAEMQKLEDEMHLLEQEPFTEGPIQFFTIGRYSYSRSRGERRFRKSLSATDSSGWGHVLTREPVDSTFSGIREIVLDLRVPADERMVRSIVDSLIPTRYPGCYRAMMNSRTVRQLLKQGISMGTNCLP